MPGAGRDRAKGGECGAETKNPALGRASGTILDVAPVVRERYVLVKGSPRQSRVQPRPPQPQFVPESLEPDHVPGAERRRRHLRLLGLLEPADLVVQPHDLRLHRPPLAQDQPRLLHPLHRIRVARIVPRRPDHRPRLDAGDRVHELGRQDGKPRSGTHCPATLNTCAPQVHPLQRCLPRPWRERLRARQRMHRRSTRPRIRATLVPLRPAALAVVAAPRAHHRLELLRRHRTSSHCVCGPNRAIKAASASACPSPFFSSAAQLGHSWIARDLAASLSVPTSPALRFHVTGATFVTGIIWPTTTPSTTPAAWPNVNVLATPCPGIEPTCSM